MELREYERAKFELAEILRALQGLLAEPAAEEEDRLRELFVRLAEDRFNLVVVGRFSRGKTSLMNAILETDSLPIGIVPLTSVITTVAYGSKAGVTIKYKGRLLNSEIPLEALPEYVTQRGNPGNVRGVSVAEVKLPAEILRRGFYFVDTPGLGSTIRENTRTTEEFLPQADAFVLVTSYESPLSEEEMEIVRAASASARRVFVVVNKQDLASPEERSEALHDLNQRLSGLPGAERFVVFSVSAREGLEAKLSKDAARLAGSGIDALERELVRFLLTEKSTEFLLRLCDRAGNLARELLRGTASGSLVDRTRALAKRIAQDHPGPALRNDAQWADPAAPASLRQLPPCEICERIVQAAFDFLCHFQYRLSVNGDEQQRHAERGGLCALHTWQYASLASTHGICTGYPALLERLSAWFRSSASPGASPPSLALQIEALLPARETCPLCRLCANTESEAVSLVAARFSEDARNALNGLSAVCLPHLRLLIASLDDPETIQDLMLREAVILERLSDDMRRYATKHDAVRRLLASDEETKAGRTAIAVLAGLRNVHMADRNE